MSVCNLYPKIDFCPYARVHILRRFRFHFSGEHAMYRKNTVSRAYLKCANSMLWATLVFPPRPLFLSDLTRSEMFHFDQRLGKSKYVDARHFVCNDLIINSAVQTKCRNHQQFQNLSSRPPWDRPPVTTRRQTIQEGKMGINGAA
jgi:hypothetical protein